MTEVTAIVRLAEPHEFSATMVLGPYLLLFWSFVDAASGIRVIR